VLVVAQNSTTVDSAAFLQQPKGGLSNGGRDVRAGVDIYDLVCISKHILGVEALGSPYRIIAADANKSSGITTFDIVEIRKLILGIYQELPNNTSYRFVDKSYVFPNPANPFLSPFPEKVSFTAPPTPAPVEFYGIKIGDVNETAVVQSKGAKKQPLNYASMPGKKGQILDVPVFVHDNLSTLAWQTSLQYNAREMTLIGLEWGMPATETQSHAWHEPTPGTVNVLWYDGEGISRTVPKGRALFYLKSVVSGYKSKRIN
jgi:hypothetical protein